MRRALIVLASAVLALCLLPIAPSIGDDDDDEYAQPDGDGGIDYQIEINPSGTDTTPDTSGYYDDGYDDGSSYDGGEDYAPDTSTDPLTPTEQAESNYAQTLCLLPTQSFSWCDPATPEVTDDSAPPQEEQPPPPPPNPADLGQIVLDHMELPAPDMTIAPPGQTLVNLWTWFWVPQQQWQSRSDSISAGQTTVTVTIEPVRTVWNTGEGTTTCDGPGEEWTADSDGETSSCGYEYQHTTVDEPGGKYTVSATIEWHAYWTCSGVCLGYEGDLGTLESDSSSARLEVRQRQSLVIE